MWGGIWGKTALSVRCTEGQFLLIDRAVALGGGGGGLEKRLCLPLTWKAWSRFPASIAWVEGQVAASSLRDEGSCQRMDRAGGGMNRV